MTKSTNSDIVNLTEAQKRFLTDCQEYGWGKIQVDIKNGQPVGWYPVVTDGVVQHYKKCD